MPRTQRYYPLNPLRRTTLPSRLVSSILLLTLFSAVLLSLFALSAYLDPSNAQTGSMRLCLPVPLHRISVYTHRKISCAPLPAQYNLSVFRPFSTVLSDTVGPSSTIAAINTMSTTISSTPTQTPQDMVEAEAAKVNGGAAPAAGRMSDFLLSQKVTFLDDLSKGKVGGWTIAMGNEAGDLDTLASSIAIAYLSSALSASRYVPLILTPNKHMSLRPENLLAFRLSSIPLTSLLHLEDLPVPSSELASAGLHFALVDSNRLLPKFGEGHVDMIIDHHADEGAHKDAPVRSIQVPTGSCASLVTKHFMEQWEASLSGPAGAAGSPIPKELATLLLAAILIDTGGLKKGGKATPVDYDSAAFLYPLSVWGEGQVSAVSFNTALPPSLVAAAKQLQESKFTVSTLTTHDLLIRDYKEFVLPTSSTSFPSLRVGLSTVPLGLKEWLKKEGDGWKSYLKIVDAYMVERELDVAGILTTFKKHKEHRRELLIIIRIGGSIQTRAVAEGVFGNLVGGLEKENVLSLAPWEGKGFRRFLSKRRTYEGLDGKNRLGKAWVQVNAEATRKQVAPILRDLIAKLS